MASPVANSGTIQGLDPERIIAALKRMPDAERPARLNELLHAIDPGDGSWGGLLTTYSNPFRQEMLDVLIPPGRELRGLRIIVPGVGLFTHSASPWLYFVVAHASGRELTWSVRDVEDEIVAQVARASKINYIEVLIDPISNVNSHIVTLWHKLLDVSRVLRSLPPHGNLWVRHRRPEPHGMEFFDRRPFRMEVTGQVIDLAYSLFHLTSALLILPTMSRYQEDRDRPNFMVELGAHRLHFDQLGQVRNREAGAELPQICTFMARALDDVDGHEGGMLRLKRMSLYHAERSCLGNRVRQSTCPGSVVDQALNERAEYLRAALNPKAVDDKKLKKAASKFPVLSAAHQNLYRVDEKWPRDRWADLYPAGLPPFTELSEFLKYRQLVVEFCRDQGIDEDELMETSE
ncbi:hypothetical protein KJ359_004534 [Pestalotiopsis sp. 9143b]|nr:hypothetical protein KJ359_004534 [Pestalotiopsis sp. 9143b]